MFKMTEDINHSDIDDIFENIWEALHEGVKNRFSDYHLFNLATRSNDHVECRTVVLRDVDKNKKIIIFHTNNLSNKINEIKKNKKVTALFYNKEEKVQLRIKGDANIYNKDKKCHNRWNLMSTQSKECYFQNIKPGTRIHAPADVHVDRREELSPDFSVISIEIFSIDWLLLSSKGHKRLKFEKENNFKGYWIAP